jgi:hypothetical protein
MSRLRAPFRAFVVAVVALTAALLVSVVPARGQCAAPAIRVQFPQKAPGGQPTPIGQHAIFGGEVVVIGFGWGTACNDTGGGCHGILGSPEKHISIWFKSPNAADPALVGHVDADRHYGFVFRVPMPDSGDPGFGVIEAISSSARSSATFRIETP